MIKKRNFTEYEKGEARKNTFIFLGLTGKGKSQIIKYLTGDPDAVVSSSLSSCTPNSNLYYGSLNTDMNHEELFCLVDTAGLCDSQGEEQDKKNYEDIKNILLNKKRKIFEVIDTKNFIIFTFGEYDKESRKIINETLYDIKSGKIKNYFLGDSESSKIPHKKKKNIQRRKDNSDNIRHGRR